MHSLTQEFSNTLGRILALDYGRKRVGVAVTDILQISANNLGTVRAHDIFDFLKEYFQKEEVDCLVLGNPKQMNNEPSESVNYIIPFMNRFKKLFPNMPIQLVDERFTSKIALQAMIDGGMKKKQRQTKGVVDGISAVIILQSYMEMKDNNLL